MAHTEDKGGRDRAERPAGTASILDTRCEQCGKRLGMQVFLGPVCGERCRRNQRRITGGK